MAQRRNKEDAVSAQDVATAALLGRIEGKLDSFNTRLDRHETQDVEFARHTEQRLERMENRAETRAAETSKVFEEKIDRITTAFNSKVDELGTKVDAVKDSQSFFKGGWRMATVFGAAGISLILAAVDYFRH